MWSIMWDLAEIQLELVANNNSYDFTEWQYTINAGVNRIRPVVAGNEYLVIAECKVER